MPVLKSETRIKEIDTTQAASNAAEYGAGDVVYDLKDGLVYHNGSTFQGIQAKFEGMHIDQGIVETLRQNGFASSAGESYLCNQSQIFHHVYTSGEGNISTGNWRMNWYWFEIPTNSATCITIVVEQGPVPYRPNTLYISEDATAGSLQTILWAGGTPPDPTSNGVDVFSFTVYRLSLSTYTVLGQMVSFGG